MGSIHANSATEALGKLSTLPLLAGRNIDAGFVVPTVARSINVVVHVRLERTGLRRVVEIASPTGIADGQVTAESVFVLEGEDLVATGAVPRRLREVRERSRGVPQYPAPVRRIPGEGMREATA